MLTFNTFVNKKIFIKIILVSYLSHDVYFFCLEILISSFLHTSFLLEKLDMVKVEINNKIESEIRKITSEHK